MQRGDSVYDLGEIRKAVAQSRENYYVSDLGEASEALDRAAKELDSLAAKLRDKLGAGDQPSQGAGNQRMVIPGRVREQLLELRAEIRFAESLHRQAAALASGWSHLLSEKLQLEIGPSYSREGSSQMDLQGKNRIVAVG